MKGTDRAENIPAEIELHQKSRVLSITFSDGTRFNLPCEYLRVYSKAAEVRSLDRPETGKENVNISRIEPVGQYAVRLHFDDGHDTGIYSWDTLYDLGAKQDQYWRAYLNKLNDLGVRRRETAPASMDGISIKLLYFAYLANKLRRTSERILLPPGIEDVAGLVRWLQSRERDHSHLLTQENLRITVNKQFAEPFTRLAEGDEVALVPSSPTPPAAAAL